MANETSSPVGVVFELDAYAGLLRRIVVIVVDVLVIWLAWIIIASTWYYAIRPGETPYQQAWFSWLAFLLLYLVVLKGSPVRTIGYRVAGVRIVDWKGRRPGVFRMLFRVLLWMFGPFNALIDFFWLSSDPHRQTLRDKCAGTYVVRSTAKPIGSATRKSARYSLLGLSLIFFELNQAEATTA